MDKIKTFTSSLPAPLIESLDQYSRQFKTPKDRIIELALTAYFDKIKEASYIRSFKSISADAEQVNLAEEGLEEVQSIKKGLMEILTY